MGDASTWSPGTIAGVAVGVAVVVAGLAVTIWALAKGSSSATQVSPTATESPAPGPESEVDVFTIHIPVTGISFSGSFMYEKEFLETPTVTQTVTNADMFGASSTDIILESFTSTLTGGTLELKFDNFPLYMPTNVPQIPAGTENAYQVSNVRGNLWLTYQEPNSSLKLVRNLDGFGITVLEPAVNVATVSGPATVFLQTFAFGGSDGISARIFASHTNGILSYSSVDGALWLNEVDIAVANMQFLSIQQSPAGDGTMLMVYNDNATTFCKQSDDDGQTWTDVTFPQPASAAIAGSSLAYVTTASAVYALIESDMFTRVYFFDGTSWMIRNSPPPITGTDKVVTSCGLAGAFPVVAVGTTANEVKFYRATTIVASTWASAVTLPATGASAVTNVVYDNSTGTPYILATFDNSVVYSKNTNDAADGTWSDWEILGTTTGTVQGDSAIGTSALGYVSLAKVSPSMAALNVLPLSAAVELRAQGFVES